MRIFLIIAHFYPHPSPRAFRWTQIAKQWRKDGHEVIVLSIPNAMKEREIKIKGITIYNTRRTNFTSINNEIGGGKNFGAGIVIRWMKYLYRSYWGLLIWPDRYRFWIRPAIVLGKKIIGLENPDILITVSKPFAAHLIGNALKKEFPRLKWGVDVGDPFRIADPSLPKAGWLLRKRQLKEAQTLHAADHIFVTNDGLRSAYIDYQSAWTEKIHTVGHFSTLSPASHITFHRDKTFHLVYLGRFYQAVREPLDFLNFALDLHSFIQKTGNEIALHFYGPIEPALEESVIRQVAHKINMYFHPEIKRMDIAQALPNNTILVNIGNRSTVQLPSKISDYLALGLPVLNYHYTSKDPCLAILDQHAFQPIWNVHHDRYKVQEWDPFLHEILTFSGAKVSETNQKDVSRISREYLDIIG